MAHRALIFDSGIGGLSVAQHIGSLLPDLSRIYVADDMFRPYGNKSEAALNARLPGLLRSLELMCQPDVIVIACNTASTTALPGIRAAVKAPVVGVVPAIKPAARASRSKTIAVLGTPGTVRRDYVDSLIADFASDCDVILTGSTALVDMAERKLSGHNVDLGALRNQLAPMFAGERGAKIDAVVLACTHFPLLQPELCQIARQSVQWVDSGAAIARRVNMILSDLPKDEQSASPKSEPDTALLVGPDANAARRKAFADFGFSRVVGLYP